MIEYITYKGKKYPLRVSYYVLMMSQKEAGLKLEELESNLESQQTVLWYALVAGHKLAGKELTLPREDMMWVLDECYLDFQKALFQFGRQLVKLQEDLMTEGNDKKK